MDDARSAWNDAADKLGGLGLKLKLYYEQQQAADRETAHAEVQGAARRLGEAVQVAFEALGAAAKDDAVKADVKQVGSTLTDALRATFSEVSGEVRTAMQRRADETAARTHGDPAAGPDEPLPTIDIPAGTVDDPAPHTAGATDDTSSTDATSDTDVASGTDATSDTDAPPGTDAGATPPQ